ncbi:MAG: hypothetical protein IPM29_00085 [Planctomycetes bacterium]|nr:hypothetical protein [Planctomycetota bacterium]
MPAPKKVWIYDGHLAEYPSALTGGSVHNGTSCTACHGGDSAQSSRAAAHTTGFRGITAATDCNGCHTAIVTSAADGLHTTLAGYPAILSARGFDLNDPTSAARFGEQCTKCHAATNDTPPQTACGQCHVSIPAPAGGGLLAGHAFQGTPSMDNNCTACHGSRVKDEFTGANNALLTRNKPFLTEGLPWKEAAFTLQADVHYSAGMECFDCHTKDEMHGVGAPLQGDRYEVTTAPDCTDTGCHSGNLVGINALHRSSHLDLMSCQVCHAQPYKNCFECHTDVTAENIPFFTIAGGDPGANHDHLMTFRVGRNPRYTPMGSEKLYTVLRHVPVDMDTFAYTGTNQQGGLLPQMGSVPTWKRATPHNILRVTAIQSACTNCHGTDYAKFWLTDAIANGEGWISTPYEPDEQSANASILVTDPLPMTLDSR